MFTGLGEEWVRTDKFSDKTLYIDYVLKKRGGGWKKRVWSLDLLNISFNVYHDLKKS